MNIRTVPTLCATGVALCAVLVAATPVIAQQDDPGKDAAVRAGSLALAPALELSDLGYDDNVFGANNGGDRQRDFTTTFSPSAAFWLTPGLVRVSGHSAVHFAYFRRLTQIRSVDTDNAARIEIPLGWITPFAAGGYANTLHREEMEIDAPIRLVEQSYSVGAVVPATEKWSLQAQAGQSGVAYRGGTVYFGNDLAQVLDRSSSTASLAARYSLTSLTRLVFDVDRQHDHFTFSPDRDSLTWAFTPGVEFSPSALVTGQAGVGFKRRTFDAPGNPAFHGVVAFVDLQYTAFDRTRVEARVTRDLDYSYRTDSSQYEVTGLTVAVTQALLEQWNVRLSVGRSNLDYLSGVVLNGAANAITSSERVYDYRGEVGYHPGGRTFIRFEVSYRQRESGVTLTRDFQRLRTALLLSYAF